MGLGPRLAETFDFPGILGTVFQPGTVVPQFRTVPIIVGLAIVFPSGRIKNETMSRLVFPLFFVFFLPSDKDVEAEIGG